MTVTIILRRIAALGAVIAAALFPFVPPSAWAVDFSGKTIEVIVPFGAGGGTDTYARFLVPFLEKKLPGSPAMIVRNFPGGGSVIGANRFQARAKPDGLTVMAVSTSTISNFVLGSSKVKYKLNTWIPIILSPRGLVEYASPSLGVKSADDIEKLRGQKLVFGGKNATSSELGTILSYDMLGIKLRSVWGLGRGKARQAFQRGEFNINYDTSSSYQKKVIPLVKAGKVVPLFTLGFVDQAGNVVRDPTFPDLPSFPEVYEKVHGKKPSGPAFKAWFAILNLNVMASKSLQLPAGTPSDIVETYRKAVREMLEDPEFKKKAKKFVGAYPQRLGDAAAKALRNASTMDPEAYAYLKDWLKKNHNIDIGT